MDSAVGFFFICVVCLFVTSFPFWIYFANCHTKFNFMQTVQSPHRSKIFRNCKLFCKYYMSIADKSLAFDIAFRCSFSGQLLHFQCSINLQRGSKFDYKLKNVILRQWDAFFGSFIYYIPTRPTTIISFRYSKWNCFHPCRIYSA